MFMPAVRIRLLLALALSLGVHVGHADAGEDPGVPAPPVYKNDCLPDPPSFSNPHAWNGSSPPRTTQAPQEGAASSRGASAPTECPDAGPDSIEAEEKDMERQFKEWSAARLNRAD